VGLDLAKEPLNERRVRNTKAIILLLLAISLAVTLHAGTIVYSYDEQHRLAGVNYDNEATARYEYLPTLACVAREQAGDKANNPPEADLRPDGVHDADGRADGTQNILNTSQ